MTNAANSQSLRDIPQVELALITGSANWGLRFPEDVALDGVRVIERDIAYSTPYGISENWKYLEFDGSITVDGLRRRALCMYSHGNPRDAVDHECHRRAYWVLQQAGVKRIVASSTMGALNRAIQIGDFVINADIVELTQTPYSLAPGRTRFDASGKQIICRASASVMQEVAGRHWPAANRIYGIDAGLVAAHAYGPRLTTPAEVMAYRTLGADLINHSLAPEATLAREIGACFVPCAFVTAGLNDYFRDPGGNVVNNTMLDGLSPTASRIALETAAQLPLGQECLCHGLRWPQPEHRYSIW